VKRNRVGPFAIDELLSNCLDDTQPCPPESSGVYLVSLNKWYETPSEECTPLYVDSNTGKLNKFLTRIGDLIADMFGFFSAETGHHSGGQLIHNYCYEKKINPKSLHIGWLKDCSCVRCDENEMYDLLDPRLNMKRPSRCRNHQY